MLREFGEDCAVGVRAGAAGTLAHTAVMLSGHAYSRRARREPTPPRQLAATAARRAMPRAALTQSRVAIATVVLHFGYGALAGVAYTTLMPRPHEQPVVRGAGYGLAVWGASYLGWIPALRLPPPATRQPPQQNLTMVLAHIAWGAALGASVARHRRG